MQVSMDGSALYQDEKHIAFASTSLTECEMKCSNRKGDVSSCVWTGKVSPLYLGRTVHIITDHKPLVAIANKPLSKAPCCVQNLLLCAQKYRCTL